MNTKQTIQEKLKDLRVERHLTLEQLSEEIYERCQTKRAFCMMAAVFVVMVTVVEFSWLGMMASGGENAFIYFRF